jgi:hypothetical protein
MGGPSTLKIRVVEAKALAGQRQVSNDQPCDCDDHQPLTGFVSQNQVFVHCQMTSVGNTGSITR